MNSRFAILVILLVVFNLGCENKSKVNTLRLGHGLSEDHAVHKGMVDFADLVSKYSNGELTIDIYSNGQLGSESQCLELLQIGSLDITKVSAAVMESFVPQYKVLGIPYIFRDDTHRYKVYDGKVGEQILSSGQEYWLKGLCFYDAGSRSFYTRNKAIRSADDIKGLKIRVMKSITASKMISYLGGTPVPIAFGELYTALQQGVVDGAENNPPSFHLTRHYETCQYYSLDKHTGVPDVMLISTIAWDRLTDQQKGWIRRAAMESAISQRQYWKDSEEQSFEAVRNAGVEIISPDTKSFQNATKALKEEFMQDPILNDLITKIDAI